MKEKEFTNITKNFSVSYSETKKLNILHFRDKETGKLLGRIIYYPETNTMQLTKNFKKLLKNNKEFYSEMKGEQPLIFTGLEPIYFINEGRTEKGRKLMKKLFWKEIRKDKTLTAYLVAQEL